MNKNLFFKFIGSVSLFFVLLSFNNSNVSAAVIMSTDSFGSSNTNDVPNWVDLAGSGSSDKVDDSSSRSGSATPQHVRVSDGGAITKTISTVGFQNIVLKYFWRGDDDGDGASDTLKVQWKLTASSTFSTLNTHTLNGNDFWSSLVSVNLPAGANNTSIDIRFLGDSNNSNEEGRVDDVSVEGSNLNTAPIASAQSVSTNEDTLKNITLVGTDGDIPAQTLTYSTSSNPTHGTLSAFNTSTGAITYTPALNYFGSDSFTFKVNDGTVNSNTATVSITVSSVNDAPVTNADGYSTNEDTNLTIPSSGVLGNDIDIESNPLTAIIVTSTTNGTTTLNSNGSFTYEPNLNFSGVDSFTYKSNDGTADGNTATVTINVSSVNDTPVANTDTYHVNEDETLTKDNISGVISNDIDVDGNTLTATLVTTTTNGSLTFNSDGSFVYTPTVANFNGTDSFTYKVNDGTIDSGVAVVNIIVDPVNDTPTIMVAVEAPTVTYTVNYPYVDGGATAWDIEDGDITTSITTVNDLNMAAVGTYTFVYTVTDSGGKTASTTRTVTVINTVGGSGGTSGTVGCMDKNATNYNPSAGFSGSCTYGTVGSVLGVSTSTVSGTTTNSIIVTNTSSTTQGQVLGASTSCKETGLFIKKFLARGLKNDIEDVKKLQTFLNSDLGLNLSIDGIFNKETEDAVKELQAKYKDKILSPWGLSRPTGIVYLTTLTRINNLKCSELNLEIPKKLIPLGSNNTGGI